MIPYISLDLIKRRRNKSFLYLYFVFLITLLFCFLIFLKILESKINIYIEIPIISKESSIYQVQISKDELPNLMNNETLKIKNKKLSYRLLNVVFMENSSSKYLASLELIENEEITSNTFYLLKDRKSLFRVILDQWR